MRPIGRLWARRSNVRTIGRQWLQRGPAIRLASSWASKKMYILPMFPYPSGDLHLGHLRVYTISDVLSRFRRMQGYNVRHPIGWDAFGLPAENAAIERGIDPAKWTKGNIQKMKSQLEAMNGAWDWDSEFATCDPSFYKHTQKLFLLLHRAGLAYQAESLVNYDPVDKTVLANEQVDAKGNSWRSGAKVEKKNLKQWFFKISEYREELLDDLTYLEKDGAWPERVLAMQKNWLGKSTGAKIKFPLVAYDYQTHSEVEVFTTRPDTLFGVQYLALSSTHPIVQNLAKNDVELQSFLDSIPALPLDSKLGYLLPHVGALNPMSYEESTPNAVKATLPIYVAPYVLGDYGGGAVMGVPGHDLRDNAFWKHNRDDDPVRFVISESPDGSTTAMSNEPYLQHGHLTNHAGPYAGKSTAEATKDILDLLQKKGLGSPASTWRLRDWLISRQRYWGTPIPIIHCKKCGPVPVPEDELPVKLPIVSTHWSDGKVGNPLEHAHEWLHVKCPKCKSPAKRDTDTMDTFVDSSWYFARFPDSHNENEPFSVQAANGNLPVDIYIGGVEHAILHLLYARFISKFMANSSQWPDGAKYHGEPFKKVLTQGMVHGKTYTNPDTGRFLKPDEVDLARPSNPIVLATGKGAAVTFEKMSKSKYNGVDPGACISKYGADAVRAHILFQAPVSDVLVWDEDKISGVTRWLRRLEDFIKSREDKKNPGFNLKQYFLDQKISQDKVLGEIDLDVSRELSQALAAERALWRSVEQTIRSVTESYSTTFSLNTVVSDLMALTNTLVDAQDPKGERASKLEEKANSRLVIIENNERLIFSGLEVLLKMLAPICPEFADRNWKVLHPLNKQVVLDDFTKSISQGPEINEKMASAPNSIFAQSFPVESGIIDLLAPEIQKCAVQLNGKHKFTLEIPFPPEGLKGQELERWVLAELKGAQEGKTKMEKLGLEKVGKIIIVRGGKTVNFVRE